MKDWKSTAAGILSFLIATLTTVSALLAGNDLSAGGGIGTVHIATWVVIGVNGALALCRTWVGLITKDADTIPAIVPGQPGVQNVPAHPVPDNPAAKPVLTILAFLVLAAGVLGCNTATSTTPSAALAPGYANIDDQNLGRALAGVNAFVTQEKINYATLTQAQQAPEKPFLNALIDATALADTAYSAYHQGSQTLAQAQAAEKTAEAAQTELVTKKGK